MSSIVEYCTAFCLEREGGRLGEREREVCRGVLMMSLIAMEEKTLFNSI